ncbi:hypothetical protein HMPREF1624_04055 [Sporothrix schenckii ATCC 58251]|uniref:Uncharacterized protein n=1 Tax=Sporothrix schenckii (strain ATCC 58251 / de Perez 2211183) TaxID=1391915 RepID=U7PWK5_SPOS1|nr:hypothetical protein HMPREF1624_04055 [Sporothrix schenckii ATCC 58251]
MKQQQDESERIKASVRKVPDYSDNVGLADVDRLFRIDSRRIKADVDRLEALRRHAHAVRQEFHACFYFADVLRNEDQKRLRRHQGPLKMFGDDIQRMPRPPPLVRTHNPVYIMRGRKSFVHHTRRADARRRTPANRRLHNYVVTCRNLLVHGRDTFVRHLHTWNMWKAMQGHNAAKAQQAAAAAAALGPSETDCDGAQGLYVLDKGPSPMTTTVRDGTGDDGNKQASFDRYGYPIRTPRGRLPRLPSGCDQPPATLDDADDRLMRADTPAPLPIYKD